MKVGTTFYIAFRHIDNRIRLRIKKVFEDAAFERFEIVARNKTIILQSDRPLLRNRGLKHKRLQWKVIEGEMRNESVLESITKCINAEVGG